ncbi:isoprenyl transferase [Rhizobium sp. S95]|uniref:Isoprenyl transferase n=1 Tax=Ciceribacter sichuanensis TaxID=2949647 RepID=A0AAJ1BUC2_9HYPH|nr:MULTISPECIES: isoprenyl transferase [unclassified Ciceribacter]MCM2397617.1 isoprenyl transferase [Ciceribacter sp. S95]MCM2399690.1 isoprenyl transferase [Ciceribacter sp. S153]MCO5956266.1 isoprenyl transferase [Ciceribacter sp. S101]
MSKAENCRAPEHVAIIMDGNGRWANARGLPRAVGHRKGVESVREIVRAAADAGVAYLTLFAFSSENWRRPEAEVNDLFGLLKMFIRRDLAELHRENVRIRIIGDRVNLQGDILSLLLEAEETTKDNTALTLVIAFNYGARDEMARAMATIARDIEEGRLKAADVNGALVDSRLDTAGIPDPDLIIRTSGEERLSNFLLWQAAYSELMFVPEYWPDFSREVFFAALERYAARDRRFGGVADKAVALGS